MSLLHLTFTQLRIVQLLCFVMPIASALVLVVVAKKKRKYVSFRFVDAHGAPLAGVVSTVVGAGARQKARAIGRLDENGGFERIFTPFEPRTLKITVSDGRTGTFAITDVCGDGERAGPFPEPPITLTLDDEGGVRVRLSATA